MSAIYQVEATLTSKQMSFRIVEYPIVKETPKTFKYKDKGDRRILKSHLLKIKEWHDGCNVVPTPWREGVHPENYAIIEYHCWATEDQINEAKRVLTIKLSKYVVLLRDIYSTLEGSLQIALRNEKDVETKRVIPTTEAPT